LGYEERNNGGVSILEFAVAYELLVANSYFKKEDHTHTYIRKLPEWHYKDSN